MEKITKAMFFEAIAEMANANEDFEVKVGESIITAADVTAFAEKEITLLANKAVKAKEKAAEKKAEADELLDKVYSVLSQTPMTGEAIVEAINDEEVTKSKVVNRLAVLVARKAVVKEEIKVEGSRSKKIVYRLS